MNSLPVGKLPLEHLARILNQAPISDERVILGPGIGLDCAVVDFGDRLLVFKSDPITFATEEIGWYAVQVNANDIATTGAKPSWMLVTALLPEGATSPDLVDKISQQLFQACQSLEISVIGGHTEITYGLERPILIATLIGEVERENLITPKGAQSGDQILITKGVPIEATAILAREFPERLAQSLNSEEIQTAQNYLYDPGISVVLEAGIAARTGKVTAMHDPTEGGLIGGLWELSQACDQTILFEPEEVSIPPLSNEVCRLFDIDPLAAIASGALLLTCSPKDAPEICAALESEAITCSPIGRIEAGSVGVWREKTGRREAVPLPAQDEIAKVYAPD
jgi:hydrogenase maturation factor